MIFGRLILIAGERLACALSLPPSFIISSLTQSSDAHFFFAGFFLSLSIRTIFSHMYLYISICRRTPFSLSSPASRTTLPSILRRFLAFLWASPLFSAIPYFAFSVSSFFHYLFSAIFHFSFTGKIMLSLNAFQFGVFDCISQLVL